MKSFRGCGKLLAAALLLCGGCLSVPENAPLSMQEALRRIPAEVIESQSAELLRRTAGEYFSGRDQVTLSDLLTAVRSDPVNSAELARMVLQKSADTLAVACPPPGVSPTEYVRSHIRRRIECSLRVAVAENFYLSHLLSPTPEQSERLLCVQLELAQYLGCTVAELPEVYPDGVTTDFPPLPELPERWRTMDSDAATTAVALAGTLLKLPAELNRTKAFDPASDVHAPVREALALAAYFRLRIDRFALDSLALRETDEETLFLRRKFQAYEICDRAEVAEYGKLPESKSFLCDLVQLQKSR